MDMNIFLMLILAIAVLAPSLASSSRFTQPPQSQSIIESDAVDFSCEATGPSTDLHYEWLHNGQRIVYDKRVQQIGSNLHIESVQREDAGDFVCIATSVASGARQASPPAKLSVICTGKTTTIVEAILQLYLQGNNRILVTAGSNSACDTIALKIFEFIQANVVYKNDVLRLYSYTQIRKARKTVHPLILKYSNCIKKKSGTTIINQTLRKIELPNYAIIVATLCTVGILDQLNKPKFTHVFIDEAAASMEPETLLAIVRLWNNKCHFILSGDHKQLGAVIKSDRASSLGLGQSLMERLLLNKLYDVDSKGDYDHSLQTRLRRNYRSHPEIVGIYNELYYNGELIPVAPINQVNQAANWSVLHNGQFPILFQATRGATEREDESTSSFNKLEAKVLCWYVNNLLTEGLGGGQKVKQEDIGVISPYLAQCKLISRMLRQRDQSEVKVGSVESYQGREKTIIIASLVYSGKSTNFLSNRQRINVLLSRPKSLLILIGNPTTLCKYSSSFQFIITQCQMKGNFLPHENNLCLSLQDESEDSDSSTFSGCSKRSSDLQNQMNKLSV